MIKWLAIFLPVIGWTQSFAPEPGAVGSTAIHKDSSVIVGWASGAVISRGPMNIMNPSLGLATHGVDLDAVGQAGGGTVVSLGDGGDAVLTFDTPIVNGPGYDFAIFENGFIDHYIELAFVEVSSDGINYTRFPAVSEIQTNTQLSNFDTVNCRYVDGFAGKYRADYGTPFDLEELNGTIGLDLNHITHIKLIDVVGILDHTFGSFDSQGTLINDPYPTAFASSGFDLDGIGVIHFLQENSIHNVHAEKVQVYPTLVEETVFLKSDVLLEAAVYSVSGKEILRTSEHVLNFRGLTKGIYYIHILIEGNRTIHRVIKQ
jgi:hypothetical protein